MRKNRTISIGPPPGDGESLRHVSCPEWAGFAMEEMFWVSLGLICCMQELDQDAYIARAKDYIEAAVRHFPSMRIDEAVRLRIAQDLRDRAMRAMSYRCAGADHLLNETGSSHLVASFVIDPSIAVAIK